MAVAWWCRQTTDGYTELQRTSRCLQCFSYRNSRETFQQTQEVNRYFRSRFIGGETEAWGDQITCYITSIRQTEIQAGTATPQNPCCFSHTPEGRKRRLYEIEIHAESWVGRLNKDVWFNHDPVHSYGSEWITIMLISMG